MPWSEATLMRLWGLLDLTSLNEADTDETMVALFQRAESVLGHVAAVCVLPRFVRVAAAQFGRSPIKVATVVNFPSGTSTVESVLIEIGRVLADGANEIDVVFPYQQYLAGNRTQASELVTACKAACGDQATLKVILETGALQDPVLIASASQDALVAGADFIKTSTGMIAEGASLEVAATMLSVIKSASTKLHRELGLKVSGGIRTVQQAADYVALADQIMGRDWVSAQTFRIGASRLADDILKAAGG